MPPVTTSILAFDAATIAEAAARIEAGEAVAVPTETVYGLAADATDADAVARIYAAKGRPSFNPLIVHVADLPAAQALAEFDEEALRLAAAFWPGPLTMVLPRRADAPIASIATAGLDTIAIRVPAHRAMRALLEATGKPLAAPSANASGAISPTRAEHVVATLDGRIGLVIDDGPTSAGLESTIVDPLRRSILRHGPVTAAMLGGDYGEEHGGAIRAPGQLASHYAPHKPLRLNARDRRDGEWLIGFGAIVGDDTLSHDGVLVEAAARLFDCLHRADAAPGEGIAVAPVPIEGLGAAINDRLSRAAVR